ncbi:MAG: glycosyltransferase family 39 protein, partial [Anaerolineae bacterium]|nr:glycosyltransferase family 39 protein [Anaerolineae bacterium]
DARHHVYFLFEWDRSVQEGIWWPRWSPDFCFGYGYPFFNIYGPLATMVGEVFHLLGADYVLAVKMVFGLAIVAAAATMYGFARRLWGPRAGFLASLAYTYAPYHILDVYVRAALPETLSLAFIPLVLWGFYEAVDRSWLGAVLWAGAAYAGLMLTSNAIALMFSPVLGLYLVALVLRRVLQAQPWRSWSRESALPLAANLLHVGMPPLLGLLVGLGLSATFWLPAATEFRYVRTDQWYAGRYDYRDDFVYPFQLLGPYWGFGTSVAGPDDEVSFQMGAVPLVLGVVSLAAGLRRRRRGFGHACFFAAVAAGSAFLMTWASAPLWEALSPVRFAQFPWRYQALLAP